MVTNKDDLLRTHSSSDPPPLDCFTDTQLTHQESSGSTRRQLWPSVGLVCCVGGASLNNLAMGNSEH